VVTQESLAASDGPVLRRELALRILLQNLLLILSLALFTAIAILALARPEAAWGAAAAHGAASLGAALQWCHHGIRTKQIKEFLLTLDGGHADGWERWLPANRPHTLLGSRWMISTKGVFLGLQLAMIGLALRMAPVLDGFFASVTAVLLLASAGFLLTNPKE
jgi:multisubunit Na+/H+ antiporter MnhG subunit